MPKQDLKKVQEELDWVSLDSITSPRKSKGIFGVLVPVGCLTTVGILACGIRSLLQRDSKKQQILMRYRVLAQGITLLIAVIGLSVQN